MLIFINFFACPDGPEKIRRGTNRLGCCTTLRSLHSAAAFTVRDTLCHGIMARACVPCLLLWTFDRQRPPWVTPTRGHQVIQEAVERVQVKLFGDRWVRTGQDTPGGTRLLAPSDSRQVRAEKTAETATVNL